jgi:hypothetical protein
MTQLHWIKLNDHPPEEKTGEVLGCHWLNGGYQAHVCELPAVDRWWYGESTGQKSLPVKNSVVPNIGQGESPYWCYLPMKDDERWVKFEHKKYPKNHHDEVLIRLLNGNHYVANVGYFEWTPSFSMFKSGLMESIDCWMELPDQPPYDPEKFTPEQDALRKEKRLAYKKRQSKRHYQI